MTEKAGGEAPMDFSQLILGFSSAALYYLGEASLPDEGQDGLQEPSVNLTLAKQNIDIIDLLKEKTQGNLDASEAQLLNQVLNDLKVKLSEKSKS